MAGGKLRLIAARHEQRDRHNQRSPGKAGVVVRRVLPASRRSRQSWRSDPCCGRSSTARAPAVSTRSRASPSKRMAPTSRGELMTWHAIRTRTTFEKARRQAVAGAAEPHYCGPAPSEPAMPATGSSRPLGRAGAAVAGRTRASDVSALAMGVYQVPVVEQRATPRPRQTQVRLAVQVQQIEHDQRHRKDRAVPLGGAASDLVLKPIEPWHPVSSTTSSPSLTTPPALPCGSEWCSSAPGVTPESPVGHVPARVGLIG